MADTKPIVKSLPQFNPTFYLAWASDVRDAFEDRGWTSYLIPPILEPGQEPPKLESTIVSKARAFLRASIPYEYKYGLETYTTAAEIWTSLEQRYASTSRQDELRLKVELMDFRKSRTDTIDQHIQKFGAILSQVLAQQAPERRLDNADINSYFLRSLEQAKIPDEDWKGFITYLGQSWLKSTKEQLYSDARTYYNTHIRPDLTEPTSDTSKVLAIRNPQNNYNRPSFNRPNGNSSKHNDSSQQSNRFGNSNRGNFNRGNFRRNYNSNRFPHSRSNSSANTLQWCDYHRRMVNHSTAECRAKINDSEYRQQSFTAIPHDYEPPLVYTTTTPSDEVESLPTEARVNTIRDAVYKSVTSSVNKLWIYDTACTETMTSEPQYFFTYKEFSHPIPVSGIGNSTLYARGFGTIYLQSLPDLTSTAIHKCENVWLVPGLNDSIISKQWTKQHGLRTSLDSQENIVLQSNKTKFKATTQSIGKITVFPHIRALIYEPKSLRVITAPQYRTRIPVPISCPQRQDQPPRKHTSYGQLMHERLGHASAARLAILGIRYNLMNCTTCILGKQTRQPFLPVDEPAPSPLFRVYCDLCGDIKPKSFGDGQYVLTLTDQFSRFSWVYILADKKSATILIILKRWLALVQNQSGKTLKFFRTDQGKEFTGMDTITAFFNQQGITHETTTGYSSSSNGVAERLNRTLFNMVRPMMICCQLPTPFWAEAIDTANKIRNCLPTRFLNNRTPHEVWFNTHRPSLRHFRQFGCVTYAHIPNIQPGNKIAPRSIQCVYLGVIGTKIYRLWDPKNKKIINSRDVIFHENQFLPTSTFGHIEHSQYALQTPFDTMTNEEPEPANYIVPPHPQRPTYRPAPIPQARPAPIPQAHFAPIPRSSMPVVPRTAAHDSSSEDDSDFEELHFTPLHSRQQSPAPPSAHSSPSASAHPSPSQSPAHSFPRMPSPPQVPTPPTPSPALQQVPALQQPAPSTMAPPRSTSQSTSSKPTTSSSRKQVLSTAYSQPSRTGRVRIPTAKVKDNQEVTQAKVITTQIPLLSNINHMDVKDAFYTPSYAPPQEPTSIEEALNSPFSTQWQQAIISEINSINDNNTWTLVRRPSDRKVIGTKFVFKLKDSETPTPRFKARLVARGYTQVPGLDYTDTFAPVVKATSVRLILAIAASKHLLLYQFDVETAFLNPGIDHEVYVEQPPYFSVRDPKEYVYLLNKALYGLKQSPLLWSNDLKQALLDLGFKQSIADESIFILNNGSIYIILAVYVDDILVLAATQDQIQSIFTSLSAKFKLRNLGPVKKFLGLDIYRPFPTGSVFLSQSTYSRKMLHKFNMADCNPVKTPSEPSFNLHKRTPDEEPADNELYRQIIGSVMFLSQYTRPDIAHTVSYLSQFNKDPSTAHLRAAKHLLRYIQATKDFAILYDASSTAYPVGYSDASYANDSDDRKSTSGSLFFYAHGIISFQSQKQPVIALSTMEAEYIALSDAAKEAIFLAKLLRSLKIDIPYPILINVDSESALDHVKNNVKHSRTKHIDVRHHFIRQAYSNGEIALSHVSSSSQIADILTKSLGPTKHKAALEMLNLVPFPHKTLS